MQGVLEIGQVVFTGVTRIRGSGRADLDPVGESLRFDGRPGARDRVRFELDTDELELREPASHGDEPPTAAAMHIDHSAAVRQLDGQLRQRREHLLEEHRDVLPRQALDGRAVAVGPIEDRGPVAEELGHPAPVHRRHDGVDELAAEEVGAALVEQDLRRVVVDRQTAVVESGEIVCIRGPRPRADGLGIRAGRSGQLVRGDARLSRLADPREETELDAEVHEPGSVEATETGDEVVEAVLVAHRRIVAWARGLSGTRAGPRAYRGPVQRKPPGRGSTR